MKDILELTEEMLGTDRRGSDGRRMPEDRRRDIPSSKSWPAENEKRLVGERRALDRRKLCVHCGETYKLRGSGQPECACRLNAIHNPGGG